MCVLRHYFSFIHSLNFETFVRWNVDLVGRSLIRWLIRLVRICYVLLFLFCASSFTRCSFVIVIAVSHFPLEQPFIICNEWKEIEKERRENAFQLHSMICYIRNEWDTQTPHESWAIQWQSICSGRAESNDIQFFNVFNVVFQRKSFNPLWIHECESVCLCK